MIYFSNIKISSILLVIVIALMFAIPNFFSKDQLNSFPSFIPKQQVNLGLDLQGGSHLLLEVDTVEIIKERLENLNSCLLYTSPSPRDATLSRMPSSA